MDEAKATPPPHNDHPSTPTHRGRSNRGDYASLSPPPQTLLQQPCQLRVAVRHVRVVLHQRSDNPAQSQKALVDVTGLPGASVFSARPPYTLRPAPICSNMRTEGFSIRWAKNHCLLHSVRCVKFVELSPLFHCSSQSQQNQGFRQHSCPQFLLFLVQGFRYGMIRYGTAWYGMLWYGMVWYGMGGGVRQESRGGWPT